MNFEYSTVEPLTLTILTSSGDQESVTLQEASPYSRIHRGALPLKRSGRPTHGNGLIEVTPGDRVSVSYGYGYFERRAEVVVPEVGTGG